MKLFFALLSALVLALFNSSIFAADYYVAPNGNNTNPGTFAKPWKTISEANKNLRPGDTVYLRGGKYSGQSIEPARSGTSENQRITYKAYLNERPVIMRIKTGLKLTNRSYITVDGIEMDGERMRHRVPGDWPGVNKGSSNIAHFATLINSHHNIIQNVDWKYAHGWHGVGITEGSHHNKMLNSRFDFVGAYDNGRNSDRGDSLRIKLGCFYNLVEGNTFTHGGHNLVSVEGRYNVFRNNTFNNDWSGTGFGNNVGNRAVVLKGMGKVNATSGFNLFEYNTLTGTNAAIDSPESLVMKTIGQGQIVRRNFYFDNSNTVIVTANGAGASNGHVSNNRIYNNVIYNNGGAAWAVSWNINNGVTLDNNIFKNNIAFNNRNNPVSALLDADITFKNNRKSLSDNYVVNNLIMKTKPGDATIATKQKKNKSLAWYQFNYPDNFAKNIQINPMFVSATPSRKEDFELDPASPAIDAGDFLTETRAAGSGTNIPVKDPYYFTNGFDMVTGDEIKVGNNAAVIILSVDYKNKVIGVDKSISWADGDPVSLNFSGQAPDLGAFEAGLTDITSDASRQEPHLPPTTLELITNLNIN